MPIKRAVPLIEFKHVPLTQCFGIQPILVKPDGSVKCNLFNLYRKYLGRRFRNHEIVRRFTLEQSDPRYVHHFKTEEEKQEIVKNALKYYELPYACMKKIFDTGRHFQYDVTLDEFLAQGSKFVTNRIFTEMINCYIYNKLVTGNRIVTSCQAILDNLECRVGKLGVIERILVPENILPKNYMVIAARGGMTFDNGILLCPLIYEKEFNKWAFEHDKNIDFSEMKFKDYPVMREYRYKMDLWGEFINDWIPLEWHFEVFEKNARNFYRIIKFKE